MAFSVAEDELRSMETEKLVGHLACWNYFQSINTPANKKFVADFKDFCKTHALPDEDLAKTDLVGNRCNKTVLASSKKEI